MRKFVMGLLLAIAAILLVAATDSKPFSLGIPPQAAPPALELSTSVMPVSRDAYQLLKRPAPGMYRCSVRVQEAPGSQRVWGPEEIVVQAGQTGETTTAHDGMTLQFRAGVAKAGDRADTIVTISRNGKVVTRQSSTVWLERESSGIQPLQ